MSENQDQSSPRRAALSELNVELAHVPADRVEGWWRRTFKRGPSQAELARAKDEKWMRATWPRPVVFVVAMPKGGAAKTPTALGVGAALGLARGGGVVVWDNNELRGSLADRSFVAHNKTVVDLLVHKDDLLRKDTRLADVQAFLNYQPNGQFWTLASSQEAGETISAENAAVVREILTRFFPVVVIDTGNNEIAPNWSEAVHGADVMLVPVKWRKDHTKKALAMLKTLEENGRDVASRAVIVGSNGPGETISPQVSGKVNEWFAPLPIVEIPPDPHIDEGAEIDWPQLRPVTRRAYQTLAATGAQVVTRFFEDGR